MRLYFDYYVREYPNTIDCDYVFISQYSQHDLVGTPLSYDATNKMLKSLKSKTGIAQIRAHMFRHTHATELIKAGWDMSYVQKRLGHKDIQTTLNTYVHLTEEDLAIEYKKYLASRDGLIWQ